MICEYCGADNEARADYCFLCGSSIEQTKKTRSGRSMAKLAGWLVIVSGVLAILNGIYLVSPDTFMLDPTKITWIPDMMLFGYLTIVAGLVAVIGGIFSTRRVLYPVCLAGGLLGALGLGFTIGFFIGVAGMTLVGFAKREFQDGQEAGSPPEMRFD